MRFWWMCTDELQWPVICTVIKDLSFSLRRKHKSHLQRCRTESVQLSTLLQPDSLKFEHGVNFSLRHKVFLQANKIFNSSFLPAAQFMGKFTSNETTKSNYYNIGHY